MWLRNRRTESTHSADTEQQKRPASLKGSGAFPRLPGGGCWAGYLVSAASTSVNFADGRITAATLATSGR